MKRLITVLLLTITVQAQQPGSAPQPVTGKRVALVIGNNRYTSSPLENCVSDAAAIAKVLREQLQFDTVLADKESENLDRLAFTRRLQAFQKEARGAAVALFYYAGHGMEDFDGRDNYLIPVDANLAEAVKDNAGLQAQGIPLDFVLKTMKDSTKGAKIILLDCCRQRPADRALSTRDGGGFVMPPDTDMPQDTLIMLAAAPARVASDGASGHGPFTAALLKHLPAPGTALFQTFRTVRNEVLTATNQQQKPWLKLDGAGDFFYDHALIGNTLPGRLTVTPPVTGVPPATTPQLGDGSVGKIVEIGLPDGVRLAMCFCPTGNFMMGSPPDEATRVRMQNEEQVKVTLTKPFWLGRTEITQSQWKAIMGDSPSLKKGDNLPVTDVSAEDAASFIAKLNERVHMKGWRFVLPTEAQWEYACRAGSKGQWGMTQKAKMGSLEEMGWFSENSGQTGIHEAGSKIPNAWGLYDMHGNVEEWCSTLWDGASKHLGGTDPVGDRGSDPVTRGGSWASDATLCRAANRRKEFFTHRDSGLGFRVAAIPVSQ